ncbi:MAG TPA: hypothetical protein VIJ85_05760 [Rhizomicrobium sp.]
MTVVPYKSVTLSSFPPVTRSFLVRDIHSNVNLVMGQRAYHLDAG